MALKATVFKASLNIADMDRHYYADHPLTIARHPSESDLRMMVRLAVFALNADEQLAFTKGISTDNEPDLWVKNYSDEIELWIELGQPDEKRIRQACGRSQKVRIYTYQERAADVWFEQISGNLSRFTNLEIFSLTDAEGKALNQLTSRNMQFSAIIDEDELTLNSELGNVAITPQKRFPNL
jgi:uncharacterized protein YaeQ